MCLATGASREAPVDNECFGQLGWPSKGCLGNFFSISAYLGLGTRVPGLATGTPDLQAIRSWAWVPLGTQAATGNPDIQASGSWVPLGTQLIMR